MLQRACGRRRKYDRRAEKCAQNRSGRKIGGVQKTQGGPRRDIHRSRMHRILSRVLVEEDVPDEGPALECHPLYPCTAASARAPENVNSAHRSHGAAKLLLQTCILKMFTCPALTARGPFCNDAKRAPSHSRVQGYVPQRLR